jgi:outer membrane biosynthesis protein TonB
MYEASEAAKIITQSADPNVKVIWGATIDEGLKDEVKVTVIATGFDIRPPGGNKPKTALASGSFVGRGAEPLDQISFSGRYANAAQPAVQQRYQPEPQQAASPQPMEQKPVPRPMEPVPSPAAHQPHVQTPTYAPTMQPRQATAPQQAPRVPKSEEDELEIPAFIRKKMM